MRFWSEGVINLSGVPELRGVTGMKSRGDGISLGGGWELGAEVVLNLRIPLTGLDLLLGRLGGGEYGRPELSRRVRNFESQPRTGPTRRLCGESA